MKVLLVEDDHPLGQALHDVLLAHDWASTWVRTALDARRFLEAEAFDVCLFDIVLPGESGLELLRWLREQRTTTPVIMLTARDEVSDRVAGLDGGADDYLGKPFAMDELLSRMRALVRRQSPQKTALWRVGELAIDTAARRVTVKGEAVVLTKREYELLLMLAASPGKVLTRSQLARGSEAGTVEDSNAVDVHVHSLRRKLGAEMISTVRGVGYLLDGLTNV